MIVMRRSIVVLTEGDRVMTTVADDCDDDGHDHEKHINWVDKARKVADPITTS